MVDTEQNLSSLPVSELPREAEDVISFGGPFAVVFAREREWNMITTAWQQITPGDIRELSPAEFVASTGDHPRGTMIVVNAGNVNQLTRLAPSLDVLRHRSGFGNDGRVRFRVNETSRQRTDWERECDAQEWLRLTMKTFTVEPGLDEEG